MKLRERVNCGNSYFYTNSLHFSGELEFDFNQMIKRLKATKKNVNMSYLIIFVFLHDCIVNCHRQITMLPCKKLIYARESIFMLAWYAIKFGQCPAGTNRCTRLCTRVSTRIRMKQHPVKFLFTLWKDAFQIQRVRTWVLK